MAENHPISRREFLLISSQVVTGVIACGISTSLGLNGCSSTPEPTTVLHASPTETEASQSPQRPLTWPLGDVPRNRTLEFYYSNPANGSFNPYSSDCTSQNGNALLYEPCAFYNAHADRTYMWLAESYQYNTDGTELDITFRKGIKWSDGAPFTADDVVWSMTTLKDLPDLGRVGNFVTELEKVEKINDLTVKLTLNQSDWRFFFRNLTFRFDYGQWAAIQAPQMYKDVAAANDGKDIPTFNVYDMARGWPISTGPYGVGTSTEEFTHYDLRPNWWAVDTGLVPAMPDVWRFSQTLYSDENKAAQMLINNEIDTTVGMSPKTIRSLLAQVADHVTTWTGSQPPYGWVDQWPVSLWFTTAAKPWDNPDVRWAVAYAIDQQKVIDTGWGGAGLTAKGPIPAFPALNKYMDSIQDITDQYNVLEFNLDKSAALMHKAGFTRDKDGWWVDKDGVKPDSDLYSFTGLFDDVIPVLIAQLRAAGFDCTFQSPQDIYVAMNDGRAKLHLFGHLGAVQDPSDILYLYRKDAIQPLGTDCGDNRARWTNPDFEAAMQEMNHTAPGDPKMFDLFRKAMTAYYTELPDCPLMQWIIQTPVNTTYWTNWPDEHNPYMNSALWLLTAPIVVYGLKATGAA